MKRPKNNLHYSEKRRIYLDGTRFGPYVKLLGGVLLVAAFALAVALLLVPWLTDRFSALRQALARPESQTLLQTSAAAIPTEEGVALFDLSGFDGTLLFAAGREEGRPEGILRFDPESGALETVSVKRENDLVRYPVEDGERLLYLDVKAAGGGAVRRLNKATGENTVLYEFALGAPALAYETPYLAFSERMEDGTATLRVLDAGTGETLTVADFGATAYGASSPSLCSGQLVYADENREDLGASLLRTVLLHSGKRWDYLAVGYVHDPKSAGDRWAWVDGDYGPEASLLVSIGGGEASAVAKGVSAFALTPGHVVYGKDRAVYAYAFLDGTTTVLSDPTADCLPLGTGCGYAVWQDMETQSYYYRKLD